MSTRGILRRQSSEGLPRCRVVCFFFQAEDGIRDLTVTGVQTCALPILNISNAGPGDATGVSFTDTIDPNTTLVPLSGVLATDDDYNTIGNVNINVNQANKGLLANDKDIAAGNNTGMTAGPGTVSSAQCAACNIVTINSDGTFTYDP